MDKSDEEPSKRWGRKQEREIPTSAEWADEARAILKSLMVRDNHDYKSLAKLMSRRGIAVTPRAIKERLLRGSYRFTFFMQVLVALDREPRDCSIDLTLPPPSEARLRKSERISNESFEKRSKARKKGHKKVDQKDGD